MALLEVLRGRSARRGGTAQVNCGELGLLTVEALSPADCARLSGDSRALLYAACRELQAAGEALRSEGSLFRPDEITAYLTDAEADAAAQTIQELSGLSEIRLQSVQGLGEGFSQIRPASVQTAGGQADISAVADEIRLLSVQGDSAFVTEDGQVSHEFPAPGGSAAQNGGTDRKSQILGDLSAGAAQIVVPQSGEAAENVPGVPGQTAGLRGSEADAQRLGRGRLHETESELWKRRQGKLHEITSESGGRRGLLLHESESEYEVILHELRSELQTALHEIRSEVREMLHETESELAEQAAQRLAEALRRAGQVR